MSSLTDDDTMLTPAYYPGDIIGIDDRYAIVEYLIPWVDCLGIRYLDTGDASLAVIEAVTIVVRAMPPEIVSTAAVIAGPAWVGSSY